MIRIVLVVLFLSMWLACYEHIQRNQELLTSEVELHVGEVAQKGAELTERHIENSFSLLLAISVGVAAQNLTKSQLKKLLQEELGTGHFDMIGMIDRNGQMTTTSVSTDLGDVKNQDFFQHTIQGKNYISVRYAGKQTEPYFYFSTPIVQENEITGVMFAICEADHLTKELNTPFYGNQSMVYIVNGDGDIIWGTNTNHIGKNIFQLNELSKDVEEKKVIKRQLENDGGGVEEYLSRDTGRMNVYVPLKDITAYDMEAKQWTYVVSIPQNAAFSYANEVMERTVVSVLIGIFSISIFFVYTLYFRKQKRREVKELELVDRLTGVGNEKYFYQVCDRVIAQNPDTQYAIIYFDINNFKVVNDTFGYDHGDTILKNIADILKIQLKHHEIYAKFPNDHFVLMVKVEKDMPAPLNKILELQSEILKCFKGNREITLSIGVYALQEQDENIYYAVNKANMARTYVKRRINENIIVYDEKFYHRIKEESLLVEGIKTALKNDEFQVYYQPKYNLQTGEMMGSEALIRWEHPEKSLISPAIFIPVAERNGMIVDIGRKVLEIVCNDLENWNRGNRKIYPVSVNLSRIELYQRDVVQFILSMTERHHIASDWIEFEITETATVNHLSTVCDIISELRNHGFKILLDDFGTGYSSLSCLKEIPIDTLKLDRSFLENFETDIKAQNVTKSIVYLAKSIGLDTIIEGVETKEQAKMMRDFGCDYVQGYYFAKPMCKAEYEALFDQPATFGEF